MTQKFDASTRSEAWQTSSVRQYKYVGPKELLMLLEKPTKREQITSAKDIRLCLRGTGPKAISEEVFTFVIDLNGQLWISDRHLEHVVCARGGPVLSAGEVTFVVSRSGLGVSAISNQSTGFCPEPQSWSAVAASLDAAQIPHPDGFTSSFDFRRCDHCFTTNLVKDEWFVCSICDTRLSASWNFDGLIA